VFTGLVEEVGKVESVTKTHAGVELRIESGYGALSDGESVVAAMVMTISRTTIGDWTPGRAVNLERAMRADTRFGGHIVQGHVDGVGVVTRVARKDDAVLVDVDLPPGLAQTLVLHGSVALDGVSLTVNALEGDKLQVALIDYTLKHTSLFGIKTESRVNVETDVIGKYVQRLVAPYLNR